MTEHRIDRRAWAEILKTLSWAHGSVHLRCDGYDVNLRVVPLRPLSYVIMPYVNGRIDPAWFFNVNAEEPCDELRRFYRRTEVYLHTPKFRRDILKIHGRGISAAKRSEINRKVVRYDWHWKSPSALQKHLIANNREIELVAALFLGWPTKPDPRAEDGLAAGLAARNARSGG